MPYHHYYTIIAKISIELLTTQHELPTLIAMLLLIKTVIMTIVITIKNNNNYSIIEYRYPLLNRTSFCDQGNTPKKDISNAK